MAEEQPSLHIDTDWKKQAQEEKRKLAEQEAKKAQAQQPAGAGPGAAAASTLPPGAGPSPETAPSQRARAGGRARGEMPQPSFSSLVQSLTTQVLFYLGDLTTRGTEPTVNLDMAKYNIDILAVLEEKTKNNLTDEERRLLDAALYETRMRYVNVASQFATV